MPEPLSVIIGVVALLEVANAVVNRGTAHPVSTGLSDWRQGIHILIRISKLADTFTIPRHEEHPQLL